MEAQPDFKELLALFNERGIEYVIVGAYALAYHGAPRFTGDIDIYVRPTPENARRIVDALASFGFGSLGLKAGDFQKPDQVAQLGVPPVRIDLITSITGVTWQEADADRRRFYLSRSTGSVSRAPPRVRRLSPGPPLRRAASTGPRPGSRARGRWSYPRARRPARTTGGRTTSPE